MVDRHAVDESRGLVGRALERHESGVITVDVPCGNDDQRDYGGYGNMTVQRPCGVQLEQTRRDCPLDRGDRQASDCHGALHRGRLVDSHQPNREVSWWARSLEGFDEHNRVLT